MREEPTFPEANLGPRILGACVASISLALLVVAIRIWVKVVIVRHFWSDDYVIVAAALVMLAQMILIILQVQLGAGQHVDAIDHEDNINGLRLNLVTQPLCLTGLVLVKISIGLLLLRLTTSKRFKHFIWGIIIFTCAAFLGNLLTVMLQCQPLAMTWDTSLDGKCMPPANLKFAAFFNSAVSVVTDLIFAILPAILLWKVQINRRTKIATIPVLSLGFLATIAGIIKMFYLEDYGRAGDFLFDSSYITIWTTVEICIAMIAACAHALKPLFKTLLKDPSKASAFKSYETRGRYTQRAHTVRASYPKYDAQGIEMYNASRESLPERIRDGSPGMESQASIVPRAETPAVCEVAGSGITKRTDLSVTVSDEGFTGGEMKGRGRCGCKNHCDQIAWE